ncbi:hypothetical protein FOA43_003142 [Brettanomyces nanus]|uniref:Brl1/Brr6 domain-containing protein n=1 Tax=Eeniella nana TaxID=13502 RepID=A0A875S227_EENNA|nr:uncharacterized protein FOA43_003142 [Brettanomyces nanus]QPG75781.1 hypothetical protein FOA43_003142 [Brettanomyces nanus]
MTGKVLQNTNESFSVASTVDSTNLLANSGLSDITLTPIKSLKDVQTHNPTELTETLRRAQNGETFLPEQINFLGPGSGVPKRKIVFPQAFSSPKHSNSGVSLSFFNSQPGLQLSQTSSGTLNPVKGAYNIFDKRKVSNSTPGRKRKRKRILTPETSQGVINRSLHEPQEYLDRANKETPQNRTEPSSSSPSPSPVSSSLSLTQKLLTDPQCITNLTLIIQILLNALIFTCFILVILMCFLSVKRDVDHKVQTYVNDLIHQINGCRREYLRNNCAPEMRVPALESSCNEWENCMGQDPESVITSVAYFEVMAECMNAFFHNLSFRTLISMAVLLLCSVVLPNVLFNKFRSTSSNTTTNNTTYYNITHDQSTQQSPVRSDFSGSPRRLIDNTVFFTPMQGPEPVQAGSQTATGRLSGGLLTPSPKKSSETSVRFNPNVSYSFYDSEYTGNNTSYVDASPTLKVRNRNRY